MQRAGETFAPMWLRVAITMDLNNDGDFSRNSFYHSIDACMDTSVWGGIRVIECEPLWPPTYLCVNFPFVECVRRPAFELPTPKICEKKPATGIESHTIFPRTQLVAGLRIASNHELGSVSTSSPSAQVCWNNKHFYANSSSTCEQQFSHIRSMYSQVVVHRCHPHSVRIS